MSRESTSAPRSTEAPRVVLAGADEWLVPLYERLRGESLAEVVALGSSEQNSLTGLLALIGGLPMLDEAGSVPEADLWICDEPWRARAGDVECLNSAEAEELWPRAGSKPPESAPRRPLHKLAHKEEPTPMPSSSRADFPRELKREIERSKRYHLGFTLSIFRVMNEDGEVLPEAGFAREPLRSFPERQGRACDSWGLSKEGYLLHLAPETLEQAPSMRKRLVQALESELEKMKAGPWSLFTAQVRFPQDSDNARDLLGLALQRLERKLGEDASREEEGDGLEG